MKYICNKCKAVNTQLTYACHNCGQSIAWTVKITVDTAERSLDQIRSQYENRVLNQSLLAELRFELRSLTSAIERANELTERDEYLLWYFSEKLSVAKAYRASLR